MQFTIEEVKTIEGCHIVHDIAASVWGGNAACSVPQLFVHASKGGVVLLARSEEGAPIGFLFSFPALYRGEWVLWSHETAVLHDYLHLGIGAELKRCQRRIARELGYEIIAWTFDPLISRNAYFNLVKLGASIAEYQQNLYGIDKGDLINRGIETDRYIAVWSTSVDSEEHVTRSEGDAICDTNLFDTLSIGKHRDPVIGDVLSARQHDAVRTCIPANYGLMVEQNEESARAWRLAFRAVAVSLFEQGFQPSTFCFNRVTEASYYIWTEVAR